MRREFLEKFLTPEMQVSALASEVHRAQIAERWRYRRLATTSLGGVELNDKDTQTQLFTVFPPDTFQYKSKLAQKTFGAN